MKASMPTPRLFVAAVALGACTHAAAGDWAEWRGPARDGRSSERGLPVAWSPAGQNLAWKAPYGARSTPVVIGDRLYLQNGGGQGADLQERVVCLNADTGKLLWEHRFNVYHSDVPPHRIGWASPAADPATGNVFAFGVGGTLLALDPAGKLLWERSVVEDFGLVTTHGGRTVSPVLDGDLVIVSGIAAGWGDLARAGHRFFAFDKRTGATVYVSSPGGRPFDTTYSPPIIGEVDGTRLLIAGGSDGAMHAIKPQTGEPVWNFVMSKRGLNTGALLANGVAIVSHSEENLESSEMGLLAGIDAAGKGALKKESVKWSVRGFQGGFSSPVLDGERFYQIDNGANLVAFEANSGKQLWLQNLGTIQKASPVLADGKLYVGTENGKFFILKPGPTGAQILDEDELLNEKKEPEAVIASVAVSRGRVYLATTEALYCIGKKAAGPAEPKPAAAKAGTAPATFLQVTPAEVLLTPGDRVQFTARLFDAQGRLIREEKAPKWELTSLEGAVDETGRFTSAGGSAQAGAVKATAGELSGSARVRVVPALPWKWDFETGAVPPQWINATGKFAVREEGGAKVLVKLADNPFTKRARVFMGGGHLANYTVEADALAHEQRRQMGDVGVVAQRYQLMLFGNSQKIELQSWQPETARTVHQSFAWKPETWYRLKLRVETEAGGVRARGKAWPAADPEPEAWTLERLDPHPNLHGSPGLYADAPVEVVFDNVRVTSNAAADAAARAAAEQAARPAKDAAPAPAADLFDYDRSRPLDVRETSVVAKDGVTVRDLTYAGVDGARTAAYLVSPSGDGKARPATLFVHWYEPHSQDSNRTQFLAQARELARRGAVSLLVETMWSDPAWFRARDTSKDYEHSVAQVRALRRALDVLLSQPDVDPARVAYVGHDFGAMYGAVLAGVDPRVTAGVALQAGTTSFADWFLISAKLQGEARRQFVERLSPLDPVHFVGRAKAPVYFQFATSDPYVSRASAEAFYAAAREPKEIRWYEEGGHGLSLRAVADRQEWLVARLGLEQRASGASK